MDAPAATKGAGLYIDAWPNEYNQLILKGIYQMCGYAPLVHICTMAVSAPPPHGNMAPGINPRPSLSVDQILELDGWKYGIC